MKRALKKRYGRAQIPKHLRQMAVDIANVVMREPLVTPYLIGKRVGISVEAAGEILGLGNHAFGPGGAGFEWMVKKVARVVGRKS